MSNDKYDIMARERINIIESKILDSYKKLLDNHKYDTCRVNLSDCLFIAYKNLFYEEYKTTYKLFDLINHNRNMYRTMYNLDINSENYVSIIIFLMKKLNMPINNQSVDTIIDEMSNDISNTILVVERK